MRRFLAIAVLCVFSLPIGLSVTGCGHNPANYCIKNGHAYGITTSQVTSIILQPETTGVSLSWGQTYQVSGAQAFNCVNSTISVGHYTYASSNLLLADISPAGTVCAGTWNRNSEGGVPNFTICTPPSGATLASFKGCTNTSCGVVQVTASGGGATSNPVDVYVHPPVTSVTIPAQTACLSQGTSLAKSLLAETTVLGPSGAPLCGTGAPYACNDPRANIGTIEYTAQTPSVVTINNTTNPTLGANATPGSNANGQATANLPGATIINASLSNSDVTSAAGYFSTCPPAKISLSINNSTTGTVTPNSPQTVVASVVDTNGVPINGLSLSYASTEPQNLSVSTAGLVTSTFPSHATVTAVCAPPGCNPAPVNLVGTAGPGNGMPVAGNPVTIDSPGRVSNQLWMASSQSPYFSEADLTTGATTAPVRLPYPPNSMVMDQAGSTLYFGSYHELMIYAASSNSLSKEVTAVPGVVLAVSPTGNLLVINDQLRQVIYLYNPQGSIVSSISGVAQRAQFSPDGTTVYITGVNTGNPQNPAQNSLFVYNLGTGWSTYPLGNETSAYNCQTEAAGSTATPAYNPAYDPFCGASLALTVPSVAAFTSGSPVGSPTAANSFCPNASATPPYYPPAGTTAASMMQLTATPDGNHILGADGTTFTDVWLYPTTTLSGTPGVPVNACPAYSGPALKMNTLPLGGALPASVVTVSPEIDQVVSSPYSTLAFVTYQPCGPTGTTCSPGTTAPATPATATGVLPFYQPPTNTTSASFGNLSTVQLLGGAQAPVAGAFSPDGSLFFVSTSGDNLVHEVNAGTTPGTSTCTTASGTIPAPCDNGTTINPKLTNAAGQPVPAQFLAVKSRSTT